MKSTFFTPTKIAIIIVSLILLQTLPYKFLGLSESVELFTKLWQEPRGRIWSGILELLGVIWLQIPQTRKYAAIGISSLMLGALYFHATILGRDLLSLYAIIVLIWSVYIAYKSKI